MTPLMQQVVNGAGGIKFESNAHFEIQGGY